MTQQSTHNPDGGTLADFLKEEGLYEEVMLGATKKVLASQLEEQMRQQNISKSEMARRMHTSRASLNRLLSPSHSSVTLQTMEKAARVLNRHIAVALV
jgi:antitoxin HicB